jgi:Repulsive guidance molecule (RGM) C-terminus
VHAHVALLIFAFFTAPGSDPKLFYSKDRHPQYPEQCLLPSPAAKEKRRRLSESISQEAAEEACSDWMTEDAKERCIFDVMATGDLSMATVGEY